MITQKVVINPPLGYRKVVGGMNSVNLHILKVYICWEVS